MMSDIDEPLHKLFPGYPNLRTGDYRKITVKDLLTMTSGFKVDDDALFGSDNRIDFALKRELVHTPGSQFVYDGGNTEILGALIKEKTGQFADAFARQNLFAPLGITNYDWDIHKQNGYPSMAGALGLLPRDMAKIGLVVLSNGSFKNQPIVSKEWIDESTSARVATHIDGDQYGYQWWNIDLKSHGQTYNTIWANGWGSQFIFIIPKLRVVIVTTGYNYAYDSWAIRKGISNYLYLLAQ
jgi:CubicO group peptidase (beta-lactamase class C family)